MKETKDCLKKEISDEYVFKESLLNNHTKTKCKQLIHELSVHHPPLRSDLLERMEIAKRKLDEDEFNNIYHFLEYMKVNVVRLKEEKKAFMECVERTMVETDKEMMVDLEKQTNEFDL